jgi:prepilin-type N-terminal cleavage/methylation domain-containing protein
VRRSRNARAGYTILELLVVVMIGGVMAKLSMGKIHDLMSQQRVVHAATAVQNDLEAAFQIAGRNRAPVRIAWDATVMQLSVTDRAGTLTFRKTSLSRQAYGFASNAVTVSTSPLEVYPNGLAADTLLVTISSNGFTKKLRMSRAGLVQAR